MAELRRHTHVPIATGEKLFSRFDFKNLFTLGAADIIQPDLSHAGGITECNQRYGGNLGYSGPTAR